MSESDREGVDFGGRGRVCETVSLRKWMIGGRALNSRHEAGLDTTGVRLETDRARQ